MRFRLFGRARDAREEGALVPAGRPRRPLRFRDVLMLTAPILLLAGYLVIGAVRDYRNLRQFDDWWTAGRTVEGLFRERVRLAVNAPMAATIEQRLEAEAPDAAIVRLRIPKDVWNDLQREVQTTWGVWVDAELMRGNAAERVSIRRRGDTSPHWTTAKLSFTLQTARSSLFKGFRELGFSGADVLPQYVAGALTHRFDLLAPYTTVAPVFVNDRFYGIYQVNEVIDESLLRRHGHMPGNIFRGDAAERGDTYKGVPRGLFMNASIWESAAINDRPAAPGESALVGLLRDLAGYRFEDHLALMEWLDRDEMARFIACMLLVGDLYHIDNLHNQFWFEDPWSGRLHPIPWDLRIMDLADPPLWVNQLLRALLRDPFLVESTFREVQRQLEGDAVLQEAERLARETHARFRPYFEYEQLRGGVISPVGDPDEVMRVLHGNARLLREWLADARIAAHSAPAGGGTTILDVESRGYAGADLVALELEGGGSATARLRADRNRNGVADPDDPVIPVRVAIEGAATRLVLERPEPLMAGWDTRQKGILPGTVHYRFFLDGAGSIETVRPVVHNRLTGGRAEVLDWAAAATRTPSHSFSPWQYDPRVGRTYRWSGVVEVRDTVRITAADTLVIAPGTTVRLFPEASVVARGPVRAEATADARIAFVPAVEGQPWGTIALQGPASSGSRFRHVRFAGGGGAVLDRIEYSGMVSIHYARDVRFEHAEFGPNLRSDDTFHAMHAGVSLIDCTFDGANSDAVDYDYSDGEIRGCRFDGSGNDAIDLMTSSPLVLDNRIRGSGDKGISIGEDSHPLVFNNDIRESTRGIEVKDRSAPLLVHNVITGNGIGVLQNVKNWRYGSGGWAKLVNTVVVGNVSDFESDADSRITRVAAAGVASGAEAPAAPGLDTDWLLAPFGIRAQAVEPGLVTRWGSAQPVAPIAEGRFSEDFESLADGWQPRGRAVRLEKRRRALVASVEPGRGGMARAVDWTVTGPARLVLELAARDADSARVTLHGQAGTVVRDVEAGVIDGEYRFVALEVPPDRYTAIEIDAAARPGVWEIDPRTGFVDTRKARLELGSYWLLPRAPAQHVSSLTSTSRDHGRRNAAGR